MRMIDAREVHDRLGFAGLIEALRTAHLGGMPKMSDRMIYQEPHEDGDSDAFIILPAWQPGEALMCKLVTSFPKNRSRHGVPTVNSIYAYINGQTGVTEAVVDGEAMIFRKTAADSALGASLLAREDARTLLMIGAGGLAPYLVRAHLTARPGIDRVLVHNRTAANAEAVVAELRAEGIPAEHAPDRDAAVPLADIVSCATMATAPVLPGALLKPGAHVDLVGSFMPEMREADDDVLRRSAIFVDHRQTTERSGEFVGPFARGVIQPSDVRGDLFDLCQGRVAARRSPDEITLMKNGGGSHLDYYTLKYLMDLINGRPFSTACASD
jgi:ornithine cyclodeaminase/alanine dehydrogenase-like protein (mu-crystallin family)